MADPVHVALARSGANAIAQWRELTYMIPNPTVTSYTLTYELGNRSVGETFEKQFVYGRAKLDLSGASLSGVKLARADLAHDNLSRVDLTGCNLRLADLQGANLQSAHLSRSDLSNAICISTNMIGCSLVRTNLSNSALQSAGLRGADLSYSNLRYTNLEGANLSETNLSFADLSWANLSGANLRGANLTAASLKLADLTDQHLAAFMRACVAAGRSACTVNKKRDCFCAFWRWSAKTGPVHNTWSESHRKEKFTNLHTMPSASQNLQESLSHQTDQRFS